MILDFLYNLCYRATFNKGLKHVRAKFLLTFIISDFFTFIANFTIPALFPYGKIGCTAMIIWLLIVLPPTIFIYKRYSNRELCLRIFNDFKHYSEQQNKKLRIIGILLFILAFVSVPFGMIMGFKIFY